MDQRRFVPANYDLYETDRAFRRETLQPFVPYRTALDQTVWEADRNGKKTSPTHLTPYLRNRLPRKNQRSCGTAEIARSRKPCNDIYIYSRCRSVPRGPDEGLFGGK